MPVVRPNPDKTLASVPVTDEINPRREKIDDIKLNARLRSFTVTGASKLQLVFQNNEGSPYDLDGIDSSEFTAGIKELVTGGKWADVPVSIKDAPKGVLEIQIPSTLRNGLYRGRVALTSEGTTILENSFRVYVSRDLSNGLPPIEEIRMMLRDTHPEESFLLEGREFADEEITLAIDRTIRYFNEAPPFLEDVKINTIDCPWRYHVMEGILGQLCLIAAGECRKNALQYSAGGLSVADKEKESSYMQGYQLHWGSYKEFVREIKTSINMDRCWGVIDSPYSYI